ncbi:MAG: hypothetical protein GY842_13135 [bacterium]|nr:hypothetical protein [bacterium]
MPIRLPTADGGDRRGGVRTAVIGDRRGDVRRPGEAGTDPVGDRGDRRGDVRVLPVSLRDGG